MMGHGHNCMRHGYVETMNCPRCDAADQKLREEGFKLGYGWGYLQGSEDMAKRAHAAFVATVTEHTGDPAAAIVGHIGAAIHQLVPVKP